MLSLSPKGDSPVTSASAGAANPGHRHSDLPIRPRSAILIVDDVLENRMVLEMFLTRHGFDVALAESGEAAIRLASHRRFAAILMDIHMPTMDGYAATRQIRRHEPPGQRALILAVTAAIAAGGPIKLIWFHGSAFVIRAMRSSFTE